MPSTVIEWMRYEPAMHRLLISFRGGRGVYCYFDVPLDTWNAFRAAPSKGTFLNSVFKEGGYGYERLDLTTRSHAFPTDPALYWDGSGVSAP